MELKDLEKGDYFFTKNPKTGHKNLLQKIDEGKIFNCENGLEIELSKMENGIEFLEPAEKQSERKFTIQFNLTEEEISVRASDMSTAELEATKARDLEALYKEKSKAEKTKAEEWEALRNKLATAIKYRQEDRDNTPCPEFFDFESNKAICINPVTNKIISVRQLTELEAQPKLPMEEEEEIVEEEKEEEDLPLID